MHSYHSLSISPRVLTLSALRHADPAVRFTATKPYYRGEAAEACYTEASLTCHHIFGTTYLASYEI